MSIAENLNTIKTNLSLYQQRSPFNQKVTLLAVSKTHPLEAILEAYQWGQRTFGENYVQEGVDKILALKQLQQGEDIEWHFIGPLQSNKSRLVAEHFDWVQTVDRLRIANRLNDQRPQDKGKLNVLIQVNISEEETKSGLAPQEVLPFAQQIMELGNLQLRGLMAIPAASVDSCQQRKVASHMHTLFEQLKQALPQAQIDTLSLGMTGDMEMAIIEGSTMVRIGTAIFGERHYAATRA